MVVEGDGFLLQRGRTEGRGGQGVQRAGWRGLTLYA